jgi:hypothetical protein
VQDIQPVGRGVVFVEDVEPHELDVRNDLALRSGLELRLTAAELLLEHTELVSGILGRHGYTRAEQRRDEQAARRQISPQRRNPERRAKHDQRELDGSTSDPKTPPSFRHNLPRSAREFCRLGV